jgi:hypothetical protein
MEGIEPATCLSKLIWRAGATVQGKLKTLRRGNPQIEIQRNPFVNQRENANSKTIRN